MARQEGPARAGLLSLLAWLVSCEYHKWRPCIWDSILVFKKSFFIKYFKPNKVDGIRRKRKITRYGNHPSSIISSCLILFIYTLTFSSTSNILKKILKGLHLISSRNISVCFSRRYRLLWKYKQYYYHKRLKTMVIFYYQQISKLTFTSYFLVCLIICFYSLLVWIRTHIQFRFKCFN